MSRGVSKFVTEAIARRQAAGECIACGTKLVQRPIQGRRKEMASVCLNSQCRLGRPPGYKFQPMFDQKKRLIRRRTGKGPLS